MNQIRKYLWFRAWDQLGLIIELQKKSSSLMSIVILPENIKHTILKINGVKP